MMVVFVVVLFFFVCLFWAVVIVFVLFGDCCFVVGTGCVVYLESYIK